MIAYKGFDKDLKCKGFQYEIGKTYEEPEAELCKCGFHACKYPLDVFRYYAPSSSRYCVVELEDVSESTDANETKCCAKKITILREITVNDMIQASVSYLKKHYNFNTTNTGYRSAATNTGEKSVASNTGNWSTATNTGSRSVATNTGDQSAATNTGSRSVATNTGDQSAATNTGDQSAATNTGSRSVATNTGDWSAATNTGSRSVATNTGNWSAATNTGDRSVASNTGNWSTATNTGDWGTAEVSCKESIAIVTGYQSKASGEIGCWLVLTERDDEWHIVSMQAVKVDGKEILPNVYYTLKDDKVVEA